MNSRAPGGWRCLGRSIRRVEDGRLVRGAGRFVDDVMPSECLHVAFVRSDRAHARIRSVETVEARSAPGVVAVYVGEDVADLGAITVNPLIEELTVPDACILARDTVRAIGQPLAAVVAESAAAAADAADLVVAELEEVAAIPAGKDADPLFRSVPGNRAGRQRWVSGDIDAAFAAADHVVEAAVSHPRLAPSSLEPRAVVAEWRDETGLTVWLSTQRPHRAREELAAIIGLDETLIRVIAPDVGGAFGMKASVHPEEILTVWAATRLRRAVRWIASRAEEFQSASHGRGATTKGALALAADGEILGLRAEVTAPLGSWMPFSAVVPARNAGRILPGPYRISAVDVLAEAHLSTTAPVGIYRGAGRPEAAVLMERLMDEAARTLEIDPLDLRRRNLIPGSAMPYATPTGETLDSGDFPALLEKACALFDYPGEKSDRDRRREAGEIVGIGAAIYIEPTGQGWEWASVGLSEDGRITAATGCTAQGQGRETAAAQMVAEILNVDAGHVAVLHGDTAAVPKGFGAVASRSTPIGGGALARAATGLRDKALPFAAGLLQADPCELVLSEAGFARADGSGAVASWREVAAHAREPLCAEATFTTEREAWGSGVCMVRLSIDADTGVPTIERLVWVDDAGTVVNPALLEGQLVGGIAQGLGEALMERVVYDRSGQLLTGSFMDYALPRAGDMPPVALGRVEAPTPLNPFGAKGVGEAGTIGSPAAILNAALDALAPFGAADLQMPLSSERLWRAIKGLPQRRDGD